MKISPRCASWLLLALLPLPAAAELTVEGKVETAAPAAVTVRLVPLLGSFASRELRLAGVADPEPAAAAAVDPQGHFRVVAPAIGMWKVRVDAPGHAAAEVLLQPLLDAVELPVVELERAADLDVEVRGGGQPLPARVAVYRSDPAVGRFFGRRQVRHDTGAWNLPVFVGRTGDDGRLRVTVGGDGPFVVRAVAPGYAAAEAETRDAGTVKLELTPGRERVVRAVDGEGRPIPHALVYEPDTLLPVAATGDDGRARVVQGREPLRLELLAAGRRRGDGRRGEVTLAVAGDEPPPEISVTLAAPPRLAGRVIDRGSRRPIAGALVWPAGVPGDFVTTAADGTYELSGEPSRVAIQAAADGYVAGAERVGRRAGDVPGPTLALTPAAAVAGRVVDAAGEPIAGVEIEATAAQQETGRVIRMSAPPAALTARSSLRGAFRLGGLTAGDAYELRFRRQGYAEARLDLEKLAPFAERTGLEVVLRRGRLAVGQVLAADESPVAGASVRLTRRPEADAGGERQAVTIRLLRRLAGPETDTASEHVTDARGRFEVPDLVAGRYDLGIEAEGFAPAAVPGVEVPEDVDEVDLGTVVLASGAVIAGRVVDAEGRPLAAAEIRYDRDAERPAVFLAMMLAGEPARARTDARGEFSVSGFRAGERVHLLVSRAGYVDATVAAVQVPTSEPLEVVMQTASRVTGKVVDDAGRPLADARVEARAEGQRFPGRRAQTAADGTFEIADAAPGRVTVSAEAAGYQGASLAGLEIPAGGELAGVTLTLAPGAVVEGAVLAPDGVPVIGATVRAVEPGASTGFRFDAFATTDGDGRYWLDGLPVGHRTVIAEHEVYQRVARDLEVELGVNRLDLVFAGGVEVSGRVLGPQGEPVAAARVTLTSDGFALSWPQTASREDGTFVFTGVLPGQYRMVAVKEGYAQSRSTDLIAVGESPMAGVELRLTAGATLTGEVRGLTVDELADVRIVAMGAGGSRVGEVDFSGRYRVLNLAAGEWTVRAELSGRQASGRVTVTDDDVEVGLDLEFGSGYVLTGTVLAGGRPMAGAWVFVSGGSAAVSARSTTAQDGTFRLEGLQAGTYELSVISASMSGVRHRETVELEGDHDLLIDLVTARLSGWVRDAFDRTPLAGVAVRLEETAAGDRAVMIVGRGNETDSRGFFTLTEVPEGSWKVVAQRAGYARAELTVDVRGAAVEDLEIEMTPTEGLFFEVALATGGAPQQVHAAVLRGGEVVAAGNLETTDNGGVRFTEVPPGGFELLVAAPGTATVALPVISPGRVGPVVLPLGGLLRVIVPALESAPAAARVALVGPSGQAYRQVEWGGRVTTEPTLRAGRGVVTGLEPGLWTLTVTADDGRVWQGQARIAAGATTEVTLE